MLSGQVLFCYSDRPVNIIEVSVVKYKSQWRAVKQSIFTDDMQWNQASSNRTPFMFGAFRKRPVQLGYRTGISQNTWE